VKAVAPKEPTLMAPPKPKPAMEIALEPAPPPAPPAPKPEPLEPEDLGRGEFVPHGHVLCQLGGAMSVGRGALRAPPPSCDGTMRQHAPLCADTRPPAGHRKGRKRVKR
jgi:hypothetical protein